MSGVVEISWGWITGSVAAGVIASIVAWRVSFRKEKRSGPREEKEGQARESDSGAMGSSREIVESLWMAINLSPPVEREKLFDRVVLRFAHWVGDLPGSESYHHSEPTGLVKHSLESALGAVRRVREIHLRYHDVKGEEDPVSAYRASEVWRYAAFLFGLFHDIGKCLSVTVKSAGGDSWSPFTEALGDFVARAGGRTRVEMKFIPGRGLAEHQALTEWLMARILPDEAVAFVKRFGVLEDILKAMHGFSVVGARGENARQFLERVKGADSASVDRYLRQKLAVAEQPASQAVTREEASPNPMPKAIPKSVSLRQPAPPVQRVDGFLFSALEMALTAKALDVNTPAGDAYVGSKFLCAVYPECFAKLIEVMKREFGNEPDVRGLEGPKDLVSLLSLNAGVVYKEPKDGFWKFRFKADYGTEAPTVRDGEAVLLFLEKLPQECREAIGRIGPVPAGWSFRFFAQSGELDVGDLKGNRSNAYDGHAIIAALKAALLSGQLSASLPIRQVFVTHKVTHFVVPASLDAIFGREEVARSWNMNRMLDAMTRTGALIPAANGRAIVTIQVGSMKGTLDAVAIDTTKIFTWEELAKLEAGGKTCNDPIKNVEKISA